MEERNMIDFVEPSKPFKPFTLRFWEREYGSEIPSFEFSRIREFYDAKKMKRPNVSGYVKKLDYQRFLLLPTLYTPMYLLCTCADGVNIPPENSYVTVEGQTRWSRLKLTSDGKYGVDSDKEIVVERWVFDSPEWLTKIKPNMDFKDFKEEIFTRFRNIEPLVQNFIASQVVGCPKYDVFFGGLNICLYDSTQKALASAVAKEIKRIVPRDIGKAHLIKTQFGTVPLRSNYNLIAIDADTTLSSNVMDAMTKRTANIGYDELSLYFGSKRNLPQTLEEPPFQLSDFPTTLNEDVEFTKKRADPSLEAFKYMQIQHFIAPIILDTLELINKIHDQIVKLPDRYDVSPQLLARFKVLDVSYYGKPQSVIRLALANTRTENQEKMNENNLTYALELFEDNFDYNYELWRDMFPKETLSIGTRFLLKLSPDERKIIRIIDSLQDTKKKCVSIDEISMALPRLKRELLKELLMELAVKRGLIIERHHQCYELIPFK
jgi:hypothetical protein